MSSIRNNVMLVSVTLTTWTARKGDKRAARNVAEESNAKSNRVSVTKALVSKEAIEEIRATDTKIRQLVYERTLPFRSGTQLLTTSAFPEFKRLIDGLFADREAAISEFISGYSDYVEDARASLGDLFCGADYPDAETVRGKFSAVLSILPLPDGSNLVLDLAEEQLAEMRASIDHQVRGQIADATRALFDRCAETVERLAVALTGDSALRDATVNNVADLVALLPSLNITGDPELAAITRDLRERVCRHAPTALRGDDALRGTVAAAAEDILTRLRRSKEPTASGAAAAVSAAAEDPQPGAGVTNRPPRERKEVKRISVADILAA